MEQFTEKEKEVLKRYCTNMDSDIYCIKNLPEEVVAVLFAYVSRSPNSFRRNLLKLLESGDIDIEEIRDIYADKTDSLEKAKEKAKKFHEKWVVGYGHGSVAEHASIKFAIDKLSIVATKILEDNRLGSYTEKSTRYQLFDKDVFYKEQKLMNSEFKKEFIEIVHLLFDTYETFGKIITEYVERRNPQPEGVNETAYKNSVKAKVCDIIRYLLPAGTLTSIGVTFNARTAEHAITKLLSDPLEEAREIGKKMLEEGKKICPALLMFAGYNKYIDETTKKMFGIAKEEGIRESGDRTPVKTIFFNEDADERIIAAILYEFSNAGYGDVLRRVTLMSNKEKENIFEEYQKRLGQFDRPLRALEHAYFTTEILVDYGAFRDIQRHRMCTQTNPLLTTKYGYEIPAEILEAGLEGEYKMVMKRVEEVYEKISRKYPYEAQYIVPLAYRKRVLITWNLRELEHFIRLRSSVQGHISYRRIAQLCWEEINKRFPLFAKYIRLNMSEEYLERLNSEIQTQKQIEEVKRKYG